MTSADDVVASATSVVIIDWPSRDVPDTLVRAGWAVFVKGGPQPDNYSTYQVVDGEVVGRPAAGPPAHADLLYSHRPLNELPAVIDLARAVGARTVWYQSGLSDSGDRDPTGCWLPAAESQQARAAVESAGLGYLESPYIADAVRSAGLAAR